MSKADSKNWRAASPSSDATAETPNAQAVERPTTWSTSSLGPTRKNHDVAAAMRAAAIEE